MMFEWKGRLLTIAVAMVAISTATPTSPYTGQPVLARPAVQPFPLSAGYSGRVSPVRDSNKTCFVPPSQNGSDSSPAILSAFQSCNQGGTVVLDSNYTIASPLNLTFLEGVDVALTGTVSFTDDIDYWTGGGAYSIRYQNSSTFWIIGGTDVNIYGGGVGVLNGNGELWWNTSLTNDTLLRPILFVADGLKGATISGINYVNPPNVSKAGRQSRCFDPRLQFLTSLQWFNLIANSTDVVVSGLNLSAVWSTGDETPNSDGWDIYRSDSVVLQDSVINNGDDCVSFKPNSTNVVVQVEQNSHFVPTMPPPPPPPFLELTLLSIPTEPHLQRLAWHLCGLAGPVRRRVRHRGEPDHLQHLHVQRRHRRSHQGVAGRREQRGRAPERRRRLWIRQERDVSDPEQHKQQLGYPDRPVE